MQIAPSMVAGLLIMVGFLATNVVGVCSLPNTDIAFDILHAVCVFAFVCVQMACLRLQCERCRPTNLSHILTYIQNTYILNTSQQPHTNELLYAGSSECGYSTAPVVCDNTHATPAINVSDCAHVASYLTGIGQQGQTCGFRESYHDGLGCTWMNTYGSCTASICGDYDPDFNCTVVAEYLTRAYTTCAETEQTLPAGSVTTCEGPIVSVTYNGEYEAQLH